MQVRSLGWKDPLEEEMATHSSIHAWKIPQRSLVGYSPRGCRESDTTEHTCTHTRILMLPGTLIIDVIPGKTDNLV